jgi:hypothetical protein
MSGGNALRVVGVVVAAPRSLPRRCQLRLDLHGLAVLVGILGVAVEVVEWRRR